MKNEIFSYEGCYDDIIVNWAMNGDQTEDQLYDYYINGYKQASLLLLEKFEGHVNGNENDKLSLPILFLVSTTIELYLKRILKNMECDVNFNTHNIKEYYKKVVDNKDKFIYKDPSIEEYLKPLNDYINGFYDIFKINNSNMDFLRYPTSTKDGIQEYIKEPQKIYLNTDSFKKTIEEIYDKLDGILCSLIQYDYNY